jgi:hypothetical protein
MHVHRVYQTDSDGNIVDDQVWIDLARIDKFSVSFGAEILGATGQIVNYALDWGDEVSPTKGRTYHTLKIDQPQSLGGGSGTSIALRLIETATFVFGAYSDGTTGQRVTFGFVNDPNATSKRKVTKVRVINNDLNNAINFPDVTVGSPPPASSSGSLIGWDEYSQALQNGTPDDSQYVDAEVVDSFSLNFPTPPEFSAGRPVQLVKFQLQNDMIENLFDAPPNSDDTVYRIDPFQTIVNVSWRGLAVEFFNGGS